MKVLVVSPHPDDESLGAGGTILRFISEGNDVYWLNITAMLDEKKFSMECRERRKYQLKEIQKFYGFKKSFFLGFPSTELESVDSGNAIEKIGQVFREVEPEMLILPDYNDAHSDHKRVFDWCYACSKIFRYSSIKMILTMEIASETDFGKPENPFAPNYFVDITEYMEDKIQALKIYDTEMGCPPFPRSEENIRAMATVRGAMAGVLYAEAFRMIKCIY